MLPEKRVGAAELHAGRSPKWVSWLRTFLHDLQETTDGGVMRNLVPNKRLGFFVLRF